MVGGSRQKGVKVLMTNAQSLGNKIDELRTLAAMLEPDVIALTETWTNDTTGNSVWDITGYEILARNDRNDTEGGRGGGILVYAVDRLGAWSVESNTTFNQSATIRISTGGGQIQGGEEVRRWKTTAADLESRRRRGKGDDAKECEGVGKKRRMEEGIYWT